LANYECDEHILSLLKNCAHSMIENVIYVLILLKQSRNVQSINQEKTTSHLCQV